MRTTNGGNLDIFGECEDSLKLMEVRRIFDIKYNEDKNSFFIFERSGEYFEAELTPHDCRNLSELFGKIADKLEENK